MDSRIGVIIMININDIVSIEKHYGSNNDVFRNYKVTYDTDKICFVPLDEANTDYQAIQQWIADGGTVIDNPPEETP
jgi:hypothetical protein